MRSALDLRRPRRRHLTPRESHCPTLWCRAVAESSAAMSAEKKEPELTLPERRLCLAHCLMKLM
jgi:hypothetical protein